MKMTSTWLIIVCTVNVIRADALAANADRASAGIILTKGHVKVLEHHQ